MSAYIDICTVIRKEMYSKLEYKKVNILFSKDNKKRRIGKPWWNEQLSNLWNSQCKAEKDWLNCKEANAKNHLKYLFVTARRAFDREVQKSKRVYWVSFQTNLASQCEENQVEFWKSIGKIGVAQSKNKAIPLEVVCDDGSISDNIDTVLSKWKNDFSSLFCNRNNSFQYQTWLGNSNVGNNLNCESLNENITLSEVWKAITKAKCGKACGNDSIPVDVLKNDVCVSFLHILFNVCFNSGIVPSEWGKIIISPIPKSSTTDLRDPLSYRGIALSCSMYKLYSSILNDRISQWSEDNDVIVDEQNGFRKNRSTNDHLSSLTNIIETRKRLRQSTFCAFIDFKKAYDFVERGILWNKLTSVIGVNGKIVIAIKSLYNNVTSCVRINGLYTEEFEVQCGLRQGCGLSPLLFNLFINDLAVAIKALDKGISISDNEKLCILLYADDIVLISDNEQDLQSMLNVLNTWCSFNCMVVNHDKSHIVHFRPNCRNRTTISFTCGDYNLQVVNKYMYLGILLDEHLDFGATAKCVAQSAGRALGLLIAKCKSAGGLPYKVFTKLYDTTVWPIISYGAAIWGTKSFSCINAVESRAIRFFLGTGRYTPINALYGDTAWQPPHVKQWKSIAHHWYRLVNMDSGRMNQKVFLFCSVKSSRTCKNWQFECKTHFNDICLLNPLNDCRDRNLRDFCEQVLSHTMHKYVSIWTNNVNAEVGPSGRGRNKLRTYRQFKETFAVETYVTSTLPLRHRSALAKFRCGTAPLRLETGRYENIPENLRICPLCKLDIENESHVLFHCDAYNSVRIDLISKANEINRFF